MTAVQQVFSDLEKLQPHLFNMHSVEGREFVNHFHKYLEIEKQQMRDASCPYVGGWEDDEFENYYNEIYKSE
jgi:phosphodiesterase/alkaline phosphatase D-like protein